MSDLDASLKPIGYLSEKGDRLYFWCPGCEDCHAVSVNSAGAWTWNQSVERPTLAPSILCTKGSNNPYRCHSYVEDGRIRYLEDCSHKLAGQTVELPAWNGYFNRGMEEGE